MKNSKLLMGVLISFVIVTSILLITVFKKSEVKVIFMSDDRIIDTIIIKKGDTIKRPDKPTKEGYNFIDWYLNNQVYDFNKKVNKNITLIAKWEQEIKPEETRKVVVTFDSNGGDSIKQVEIKYGNTINKPVDPIKDGYEFVSWQYDNKDFDFDTKIIEDITLVAKWNKTTFTVIFDSNGGSRVLAQRIKENNSVTKPNNPTKEGYTFVEWQLNGIKYNFDTKITDDITLVAKWNKDEVNYTVTFNSDGGSSVKSQSVKENTSAVKPSNPTKEGYTFVEWQLDGVKYNFSSKVTNDITLIAKWSKDENLDNTENTPNEE